MEEHCTEHKKEIAEEWESISIEAKDNAKTEMTDLGKTLAIITGAATAIGLGLNALEDMKLVSPYYKATLGVGATFLALTGLTYHSTRTAFNNAVSKYAKNQEIAIRNGTIEAQEKLPLIEDAENIVKKNPREYNVINAKYILRAFTLASAMGLASKAYYSSPNKDLVTVDRSREQIESEELNLNAPSVMSDPPRQPLAPALH